MVLGMACAPSEPVEPGRYEVVVTEVKSDCYDVAPVFLPHENVWACTLGSFDFSESPQVAADPNELTCVDHPFTQDALWEIAVSGGTSNGGALYRLRDVSSGAELVGSADEDQVYARGESPLFLVDGPSEVLWDVVLRPVAEGFRGRITVEIPRNDVRAEHCFVDLEVKAQRSPELR